MPYRVLGIDGSVAVCNPCLAPTCNELLCNMWVSKVFQQGVVIELLQYPLHALSVDSGRGLDLKEAPHIGSEDASIVELLTHRKHLLSVYRTRPRRLEPQGRTSSETGCQFLDIP